MRLGSFHVVSPVGLLIEDVTTEPYRLLIIARHKAANAACPECGQRSGQVHSNYDRRLTDLPSNGRAVHLRIRVRRFRCASIDLLPDREPATVADWLSNHPEIAVASRDRGAGCGRAASKGAPRAVQVADRWHLMENASAAFLEAVRRSMRAIHQVLGAIVIDTALLTSAERIQCDGFQRRRDNSRAIKALAAAGKSIKEITRSTGRSRKLVRSVLRGSDGDVFRCGIRVLEPHTPARRDHLSKVDAVTVAAIETGVPALDEAASDAVLRAVADQLRQVGISQSRQGEPERVGRTKKRVAEDKSRSINAQSGPRRPKARRPSSDQMPPTGNRTALALLSDDDLK